MWPMPWPWPSCWLLRYLGEHPPHPVLSIACHASMALCLSISLTFGDHMVAVIDNKTVITGSFNWSPSAAHTNDETLLVIHSHQLAKHFTREMDRLWDTAELGITPRIQRKLDRQKIRCGDGVERR